MDNPIHMNKDKRPAIPTRNKLAIHTRNLHYLKVHMAMEATELMVRAVEVFQEPPPKLTPPFCRER